MQYSICLIDDEIPASGVDGIRDTELLNSSNLYYLLKQQEKPWTDEIIKKLVQTLLDAVYDDDGKSIWDVYGYTNPSFYINALNYGTFRSDIVTFDWDYPGITAVHSSENLLKEILDKTYSLIFIFSKADKKEEIEAILVKKEFQEYQGRVYYLDKAADGNEQTAILLTKAKELYEGNFSFKYAKLLRRKAAQTMDKILSDMGKASLNDLKYLIGNEEGNGKEFIDFMTEKFRSGMATNEIFNIINEISTQNIEDPAPPNTIISKMWSYRIYFSHETGDELVRCGDIVCADNVYYFIVSADCDLSGFWKKNLGIINMVTLHEFDKRNDSLKKSLTLCTSLSQICNDLPNSLLGKLGNLAEGPFIFPFVPAHKEMKNFLAIPKDFISRKIQIYPENWNDLSNKDKSRQAMKYSYWPGAERICSVSEPFLTPVVQHILKTIAGNGVPDYSQAMKDTLKLYVDDFKVPPNT
jgi:hypothetical protein